MHCTVNDGGQKKENKKAISKKMYILEILLGYNASELSFVYIFPWVTVFICFA